MEIREKILAKSMEMFRRYGMRSVTMDELASQCGISKKTLYLHFADKDSLVESIVDILIARSTEQCGIDNQRSQNAIHELFLSIEMVRTMFEGINPAMFFDLHKYHAAANRKFELHKGEFIRKQVEENLRRGMAEGLYRPDIKVPIITQLHLHNIKMFFEADYFLHSNISLHEWQNEMMLHFIYGLATPKGVKLIEKYRQQQHKLQTA